MTFLRPAASVAALQAIVLLGGGGAASAALIDFSETGQRDDVRCASEANVSYCDENKFQYGWYASFILISDYDFSGDLDLRADPGTYFTPISIDLDGDSYLTRSFCDAFCRQYDPEIGGAFDYAWENLDRFTPYDTPWLSVQAFRDETLVVDRVIDPTQVSGLTFGEEFQDISRLRFDLALSYFEDARLEDDGYVYTCLNNRYYYCFDAGLDNFVFTSSVPAMIPLPAGAFLLPTGLIGLALIRRRRGRPYGLPERDA